MQQYYYLNGNQQVGPFTVEQLGQQSLNGSTFVWAQGMTDWKRLADVPELSALFPTASPAAVSAQPPLPGSQPVYSSMAYGVPPKNWLVESILVTVFCC